MKLWFGVLVALVSVRAFAEPTPKADAHDKQLANDRAQTLQACLAKTPTPPMHVTQTNPFLGHKGSLEQLLHLATETCAPPRKWLECIDDNATGALWENARRAEADHKALLDRSMKVTAADPCAFYNSVDAHPRCVNGGRDGCIEELNIDIEQMQCSWQWFENVVAAENNDAVKQAKAQQTTNCQNADQQEMLDDQKTIASERDKERKDAKDAEEQKKKDEEAKKQADAKRKADEEKKQREREEAERRREAEIQKRKMIHDRYVQEVKVADAANQQNAQNIAAVMTSLSGGGNEPYGSGSYRHFEFGMAFEMVPIEGVTSGSDVMTSATGTFGFGLGFSGGLDYAPLHHPSFTLGGYGHFTGGGMALAGGSSYIVDLDGGLFGSIGPESGTSLTARAGIGFRIAGNTSDSGGGIVDANTIASDAYSYEKLRAGIRWCAHPETSNKDFCASSVELRLGTDMLGSLGSPIVLGLEYDNKRFLDIGAEVGFSYPRDITGVTPPPPMDDPNKAFMLGFHVSWSWDHFGGAPPPEPAAAPTTEVPTEPPTEASEPTESTEPTDETQPTEPASGSDATSPTEAAPPTDAETPTGDTATTRPTEHDKQQPARTATAEPAPQPDATAEAPVEPPLAHERRRFSLAAGLPINCESLHGVYGTDYGGCGAGLRVGGDTPIGGVHFDLLGAGFGSTGIRFGADVGTPFKRVTGHIAYALRGTVDFAFEGYDVANVSCPPGEEPYCNAGPTSRVKGTDQVLTIGGMVAGSYTLGSHSLEGGFGVGYAKVTYDQRDDTYFGTGYEIGRGDGYFVRLFVGARL